MKEETVIEEATENEVKEFIKLQLKEAAIERIILRPNEDQKPFSWHSKSPQR